MAFTFPAMVAWDPTGKQTVKGVSFQVYAVTDTAFTTPLPITDPFNNPLPGNILNSGSMGVFPQFRQATNATIVIADSTKTYAWTVVSSSSDITVASFISITGSQSALAVQNEVTAGATSTLLAATYASAATAIRVSDLFISVGKYGTVNAADNTAAIAQALSDAGTAVSASGPRGHDGTYGPACRAVYFPAGVWNTTAQVVIPRGVTVTSATSGAVLRATASITGALLTTDANAWEGQAATNLTIDCNLLAQDGLAVRVGRYSVLRDVHIDDPLRHGITLGDTGLSASCFEMKLFNTLVRRRTGQTIVSGSQGMSITTKCSDSVFDTCVAVGFETGFSNAGGDNRFVNNHVWGYPGALPSYAFDDISGSFSHYSKCIADSPNIAGFRFRVGFASMSDCSVFLASSQTDNTVIGVKFDAGASNFSAVGNRLQGASSSVRLAADYQGADTGWKASSTIVPGITAYTVTTLPQGLAIPPYSMTGQLVEKTLNKPGTVVVADMPLSIFWSVPVQADSVVIRAYSGTGTQFQVWQGGTQLTPTFNLGDLVALNNPYSSGVPVTLAAYAGIYIKVITAGTGSDFSVVFKAYKNG